MSEERYTLNKQLAQMLKGGVIMDVTTPQQAKIAEEAGACAVMALERIPADIRAAGGVSRPSVSAAAASGKISIPAPFSPAVCREYFTISIAYHIFQTLRRAIFEQKHLPESAALREMCISKRTYLQTGMEYSHYTAFFSLIYIPTKHV